LSKDEVTLRQKFNEVTDHLTAYICPIKFCYWASVRRKKNVD